MYANGSINVYKLIDIIPSLWLGYLLIAKQQHHFSIKSDQYDTLINK